MIYRSENEPSFEQEYGPIVAVDSRSGHASSSSQIEVLSPATYTARLLLKQDLSEEFGSQEDDCELGLELKTVMAGSAEMDGADFSGQLLMTPLKVFAEFFLKHTPFTYLLCRCVQ